LVILSSVVKPCLFDHHAGQNVPDTSDRPRPGLVLPDELAALLPDVSPAADDVCDTAVRALVAEHTRNDRPDALDALVATMAARIAPGESRHHATLKAVVGAMKEARAGLVRAAVLRHPGRLGRRSVTQFKANARRTATATLRIEREPRR
jgi:hypothetical protein